MGSYILILSFLYVNYFLWDSDRDNVIDNQAYIDYFAASGLERLADFWDGVLQGGVKGFASLFTEELLWWCWIVLLSGLDPLTAIRVTTICISFLMFAACLTYRNSLLAWTLWLLHPLAFSMVGYYQIRQGFALSIYLGSGAVFGRYGLGLVLASLVHTTFLVPLSLYLIAMVLNLPRSLKVMLVALSALAMPFIFAKLFEAFGGRRTEEFSVSEGATSLTFLMSMCLFLLLPTFLLARKSARSLVPSTLVEFVLNYLSLIFFLISSFFIFPLGTNRMGYYAWFFAIPIIGSLDFKFAVRMDSGRLIIFAILSYFLAALIYLIAKFYFFGKYFCFDLACANIL